VQTTSSLTNHLPAGQPPQERLALVDGARMRYLQAGSGRPLILLHGLMGYSFSWRFNLSVLSQHATVYAIDQLGAGYSDRPAQLDCRLSAVAERVLKFVRAVGISTFDLLGTSHGGAVAMMAAALCQQTADLQIDRLILVAPVNPWSPHGRRLAPFLGSPVVSSLFLRSVKHLRWVFPYWLARMYGNPQRIPAGTLEGYEAPVLSIPGSWQYGLSIVRHWREDLQELERAIPHLRTIPALLLWGSADVAVYADSAEQLRRHFDSCDVEIFPGVGHLPYEESPDQFNTALIEFLTRSPKGSTAIK
jgi:pimeloyl-ACP methyl ester carboxylesterase